MKQLSRALGVIHQIVASQRTVRLWRVAIQRQSVAGKRSLAPLRRLSAVVSSDCKLLKTSGSIDEFFDEQRVGSGVRDGCCRLRKEQRSGAFILFAVVLG